MNKLLKFFIPKITFETLKFFGAMVALAFIIHIMPIEDELENGFIKTILYVVFPLLTYFNRTMYLPISLDWILLTPIKKMHVILVHGFINIYKILFLFLLVMIFLYLYDKTTFAEFWTRDERIPSVFKGLYVSTYNVLAALTGLSVCFIFGILPNYVQTIQQQQNYKVKQTINEKVKKYSIVLVILFLLVSFFTDANEVESHLPWFIKTACLLIGFLLFALHSTLKSLRYYFSSKTFFTVGSICLVAYACFLYSFASNDILSKRIHVKDKIQSLEFLGAYSNDLDKRIESELLDSKVSLTQLSYRELRTFLSREGRGDRNLVLAKNWESICEKKKDYTCRLAYFVHFYTTKGKTPLDLVRKSCPNDLGSCYTIHDDKEVPVAEQKIAKETLSKRCENNKNEFEQDICLKFKNYSKKKKENEAKHPTTPDSQSTSLSPKTSSPPAPRPSPGGRK